MGVGRYVLCHGSLSLLVGTCIASFPGHSFSFTMDCHVKNGSPDYFWQPKVVLLCQKLKMDHRNCSIKHRMSERL